MSKPWIIAVLALSMHAVGCASGAAVRQNPASLPPTNNLYTHVASAGGLVFVAGQVPLDSTGQLIGRGDMRAQARQVYANVERALRAAGLSWDHVVKTTTYVTDASQLAALIEARRAVLGDGAPPNTLVQVVRLAREEWMVEVEAIAVRP